MTDEQSTEEIQEMWLRIKNEVLQNVVDHDTGTALPALNRFIDRSGVPAESRSDALGLRAELRFDAGDYSSSRADLLLAHSLASAGYLKYVHELSLGSVCRAERNPSEALKWYRSALQTSLDAKEVSGGTALKNFVTLLGEDISAEDLALCRAVIARSWVVLGLSGEAATHDLAVAITRIKEGETNISFGTRSVRIWRRRERLHGPFRSWPAMRTSRRRSATCA
jgi:hypothetical protein